MHLALIWMIKVNLYPLYNAQKSFKHIGPNVSVSGVTKLRRYCYLKIDKNIIEFFNLVPSDNN